ncbi:dTDP-4-dehydrorhamnose 3,5-epimerase [Anaerolineae bacterium]|nr:dTDP-4-dehydrorhamnose 3,5-epimerase [Anaerolineae bacterium]
MEIRTQPHPQITTRDDQGQANGLLVPIYNVHDNFFAIGREPQQVYLTTVLPRSSKGPHLHHIRTSFFTCIKGNVRIVVKIDNEYREYYSGEAHQYCSIEIPTGVAALIQNLSDEEAFVLNMPCPAWTPAMQDEHTADFSDYLKLHPISNEEQTA